MAKDLRNASSAEEDPWEAIVSAVVDPLEQQLKKLGLQVDRPALQSSLDLDGGSDWDAAVALHRFGKALEAQPDQLAADLAGEFPIRSPLESVESNGAYLNFRADPSWLARRTLELVFTRGPKYGHRSGSTSPVCVEHTSANPTGPFHVGRVRNAIIGDTLARILRAVGSPVTTQYYVDDIGRQSAMITWIWSKPRSAWPEEIERSVAGEATVSSEKPDHALGRPYPHVSKYLKEHPDAAQEVAELTRRLELGTAPPEHQQLARSILDGMLQSLARLSISFDEMVWESSFLTDGSVGRVVERLQSSPRAVTEENGAAAIDASVYGLPKDSEHIVFRRSDGTSLYPTRDVAYHLAKFARFPLAIDVLGQDHLLHAKTLDVLLQEIGESRRPEYLLYQYVTAPQGGKMSTRGGSAVYLDDLLEEAVERARAAVRERREDLTPAEVDSIAEKVACGGVRYLIARVAADKAVAFRWDDALTFEGRTGPFIQYSYARASSLLRKVAPDATAGAFDPDQLTAAEETSLVKAISRFPSMLVHAAQTRHIHTLAGYAYSLAEAFNRFYQTVPVLKSTAPKASRIALVAATRQTLGNALELLGMERLETM